MPGVGLTSTIYRKLKTIEEFKNLFSGVIVGTFYNGTVLYKSNVTYEEHLIGHYDLVVEPWNFLVYQVTYHPSRSLPKMQARVHAALRNGARLWYHPTNNGQAYIFNFNSSPDDAEYNRQYIQEALGIKQLCIPEYVRLPFRGTLQRVSVSENAHVVTAVRYEVTPELEQFLRQYT